MPEPIGITLAALALLDPAIKTVRKAYGIYKLTEYVGEHCVTIQRRLDGEQARLEVALETDLVSVPERQIIEQVRAHLSHISTKFQACQDMIAVIGGHLVRRDVSQSQTQSTVPQSTPDPKQANKPSTTQRHFFKRMGFHSKKSKREGRDASPAASGSSTSSEHASQSSESTLASTAGFPQSLQDANVQEGSKLQASAAKQLQDAATIAIKAKWLTKRSAFIHHLEEIHASIDFIRDIVSMRALTSIHNLLVVPISNGTIPEDVLAVQHSLQRLHRALSDSNKRSTDHTPIAISIRILKASDYIQMKKKIALQHDYTTFRTETAVYPLQLESADPSLSTMVLAETLLSTPQSSTLRIALDMDVILSRMLHVQAPEADESLHDIGSIATPNSLTDIHQLFQDISASWVIQDTLAGLIKEKTRYRTYCRLAVQIAISYSYFVSLGSSHPYPRLMDYRYYDPIASERKALGPDSILMPYLSVGFGSKAPKRAPLISEVPQVTRCSKTKQ
ncbi:hypothetical protein ABVK25_009070 [Lepraria finkii]|uniref:Prion-inhibition and propagation HeLo domain-containing protein n=1 Tax=Lepraria finkii TaxID=1340010 RepID=A0ABR4AYF0_9LECA